jgi:type IV fimbrial biogenesis protein FimT
MRNLRGFTLVELLVTLAIAALLVTLAAPSFKRTIQSNSVSSAVNTFMSDMRFARSEAVRRGGNVILCRTDTPEAATPSCATSVAAGAKGWATGWIVFQDINNNGNWSVGDQMLRVQAGPTSMDSILEGTATNSTVFRFTATGRLLATTQNAQLTFGGSNYASPVKRVVCVSAGGRPRIAGDGTSSCGSTF